MQFKAEIDESVSNRFEMALQLTGETKDTVVESLLKAYIVQAFSQAASAYQCDVQENNENKNYGKAIHKIPKWAQKPMVIPSKIIRAYLKLEEAEMPVSYSDLMLRCSDKERYPDEFVATFANNFAQMKFDDDKSHGKVFEVSNDHIVTIWNHVKGTINMNKERFKNYSTAVGFVNKNGQKNLGRTNLKGTDHEQWLYEMQCEKCGYVYHANGSDIHLKKCPACQGGANTGNK